MNEFSEISFKKKEENNKDNSGNEWKETRGNEGFDIEYLKDQTLNYEIWLLQNNNENIEWKLMLVTQNTNATISQLIPSQVCRCHRLCVCVCVFYVFVCLMCALWFCAWNCISAIVCVCVCVWNVCIQ